jgi:hypothetical protein
MSKRQKLKRRRRSGRRNRRLQLVHTVSPTTDDGDARAIRLDVPAIPETAAREIHVLCVSLHDAVQPPPYRLLEVPSAMTLDRLHEVLEETFFGRSGLGSHSFVTIYGEFFGLKGLPSRAARRAREPRDESDVTLAHVAGEEGLGIVYLNGYDDDWRVDIWVERILPAAPGVAYPRCTGGRGDNIPGDGFADMEEFNAEREPFELDMYFDPEELTEDLADLATVIVPGPLIA